MEWLKEALLPLLVVILGYVVKQLTPWLVKLITIAIDFLKKKITDIDSTAVQTFVSIAANEVVLYVQQKYEDLSNTEKFDKAVVALEKKVDDFTERLHLGREIVSKQDIEIAIEASIKALKDNWTSTNP